MDNLPVFEENELTYNRDVKKLGRTTGPTHGRLGGDMESVKIVTNLLSENYFILYDLFIVHNISATEAFFKGGDSGSGVILVGNPNKALGIAIAYSTSQTLVCKISKITKRLNLTIKQSKQNTKEDKESPKTKSTLEQKMEWAPTFTGHN